MGLAYWVTSFINLNTRVLFSEDLRPSNIGLLRHLFHYVCSCTMNTKFLILCFLTQGQSVEVWRSLYSSHSTCAWEQTSTRRGCYGCWPCIISVLQVGKRMAEPWNNLRWISMDSVALHCIIHHKALYMQQSLWQIMEFGERWLVMVHFLIRTL